MKITIQQMRQMQEMGLIKSAVNVGIRPEQVFFIKLLVQANKYKSINQFVRDAVEKKLQEDLKNEKN